MRMMLDYAQTEFFWKNPPLFPDRNLWKSISFYKNEIRDSEKFSESFRHKKSSSKTFYVHTTLFYINWIELFPSYILQLNSTVTSTSLYLQLMSTIRQFHFVSNKLTPLISRNTAPSICGKVDNSEQCWEVISFKHNNKVKLMHSHTFLHIVCQKISFEFKLKFCRIL